MVEPTHRSRLVVLLAVVLMFLSSFPSAHATPVAVPAGPTWSEILAKYEDKSLTNVQRKAFLDGLPKQRVENWQGQVVEVDSFLGSYWAWIDMPGNETKDVNLKVRKEDALSLNKGQTIVFSGAIYDVDSLFGFSLWLDNTTYGPAGATRSGGASPAPAATATGATAVKVKSAGNLRSGPGANFPVIGSVQAGQVLQIAGRNGAADWFVTTDSIWINKVLLVAAPNVPVAATIPAAPKATVAAPKPAAAPPNGKSLKTPIPLGQVGRLTMYDGSFFDVRVVEVVRGATASNVMREANMFNGEPEDGNLEWLLVRIAGVATKVMDPTGMSFGSPVDMRVYASNRVVGYPIGGVPPEPDLHGVYLTGAEINGWVALFTTKADPHPVLWIEEVLYPERGKFFALTEGNPNAQAPKPPAGGAGTKAAGGKWVLVADSAADFAGNLTNRKWWPLWSDGRNNFNWQEMPQAQNDCARVPNRSAFICPDRAATGPESDVTLQYKPPEGGKYLFEWRAKTVKGQGSVFFYRHLKEVYSSGSGVSLPNSVTLDGVAAWEQFFFVIRTAGDPYETEFQARVYRWSP